ncbi:MAG: hypothetical protein PHS95_03215 [Candidatus Pacebacteria bacterium]|nr:hypothetical protein [Candidatus Paceibacterota bacterium]
MKTRSIRLLAIVSILLGTFFAPTLASAKTWSTITGKEILPSCNADYQLAKGSYNCELTFTGYITPRELNEGVNVVRFSLFGVGNFRMSAGSVLFVDGKPVKADGALGYKRLPGSRKSAIVTMYSHESLAKLPVRMGKTFTIVVPLTINERTMMADLFDVKFLRQK